VSQQCRRSSRRSSGALLNRRCQKPFTALAERSSRGAVVAKLSLCMSAHAIGLGKRKAHPPIDWPESLEGQIAELCRDLSVQARQMRRLQEQADELHAMIRRIGRLARAGGR
jgi:hypothetical protein